MLSRAYLTFVYMRCRLQCKVLHGLEQVSQPYHAPTPAQCEAAGTCYTCHGDAGIPGVTCQHCKLDRAVTKWETKLFMLVVRAHCCTLAPCTCAGTSSLLMIAATAQ